MVEGGRGFDTLDFRGADRPADETFSIDPANGSGATFIRPGNGTIDLTNVERIQFEAQGQHSDNITINDLTGTDVKQVAIDLGAATGRRRRWFADTVSINATNGQAITVTDHNGVVTVSGLASTVTISNFEEDRDHLFINGQPVTVTDGQTVTVAAVNSDNTGGTSTASDGSHAVRAARPVHGIELRDGRRWSRCNTDCRSTTGPAAVAGAAARLRRHRAPENASEH